jgi:hypothetical protein
MAAYDTPPTPTPTTTARPRKTTLAELVAQEPQIQRLLDEAAAVRDDPEKECFCANILFSTLFKPRLLRLVGWNRVERDPVLSTSLAYDLAFDAIYDRLPSCRNCLCLSRTNRVEATMSLALQSPPGLICPSCRAAELRLDVNRTAAPPGSCSAPRTPRPRRGKWRWRTLAPATRPSAGRGSTRTRR